MSTYRVCVALAAMLLVARLATATAPFAPPAFDPPVMTKAQLEDILHALPPEVTAHCLDAVASVHAFTDFAGQNKALEAASRAAFDKSLEIGRELPIALDAASLFDAPPLLLDGFFHYIAAVASRDAYQVALEADLANLRPGDEVFVIDPQSVRAFGPFDAPRTLEGFAWLPMTGGDTAVLVVRSVHDTPPEMVITALSHGYIDLAAELAKDAQSKVEWCNNHIACETDPDIQFLSSGVGRYTYSRGGGTSLCSGALLNVPGTAALEPYFLTASHCVDAQSHVASMQVWWDYRAANCQGSGAPPLGSLPTSFGVTMLGTSSTYDHTLAELGSVPSGAYGRAYLGWDTTAPSVNDELIGMHHPVGSAMRISYGKVTIVSMTSSTYPSHIRVEWYDGVTEGGSSGSPLLLPGRDLVLIGVLHGGAVHVCPEDPARNWDVYGPFRLFYPAVQNLLTAQDGGGGNSQPRLEAPASWGITGSNITLQAHRVVNEGAGTSGTLRLRVFATASPYSGQTAGYAIGTATLGGLAGNGSLSNVSRTVPYNPPPYGAYHAAMLLEEFRGASTGYVVTDFVTFPNTHTLGTPPVEPPGQHGAGFKYLETDVRERVFPAPDAPGGTAQVAPGGTVALRLSANEALAPDSLWATAQWLGSVEPVAVLWRATSPGDDRDGWALVQLPDALPEGAVVTVAAGMATVNGYSVESMHPFEAGPPATADAAAAFVELDPLFASMPAILATPVSPVYRIAPQGVYGEAAAVRIPVPEGAHPSALVLHYHSEHPEHAGWRGAQRAQGWLASGPRVVRIDGAAYLEFAVNHSGLVQLGRVSGVQLGALGPEGLHVTGGARSWAVLALVMTLALAMAAWPARPRAAMRVRARSRNPHP